MPKEMIGDSIILAIERKLNCKSLNYSLLKGASGCVYKVKIDSEPYSCFKDK